MVPLSGWKRSSSRSSATVGSADRAVAPPAPDAGRGASCDSVMVLGSFPPDGSGCGLRGSYQEDDRQSEPGRRAGQCGPDEDGNALPEQNPATGRASCDEDRRGDLRGQRQRAQQARAGNTETDEPLVETLTALRAALRLGLV